MMGPPHTGCATLLEESERRLSQRQLPEAIACFHAAEAAGADPDRCSAGLWMAYMLCGDFESAWQQSDSIRARGNPDPNRFWNGEPIAGKHVILRCLHGFGDAVQFLRYLPRVAAIAAHVTLQVPPRFIDLARCFDGVDEVITWGEQAPLHPPTGDLQLEIMELPYVFRTKPEDLPIATRYLHLPASTAAQHNASLQIGLSWTTGSWNPSRGIPFRFLDPLFTVPHCEFWSLEASHSAEGCACCRAAYLHRDPQCGDTLHGLATAIAHLDLVITVDTLAAHLAGALSVPTYLLLQHQADWRWMHDRIDTPWYPSLRLFRQPTPGDWPQVIASIHHALLAKAQRHAGQAVHA